MSNVPFLRPGSLPNGYRLSYIPRLDGPIEIRCWHENPVHRITVVCRDWAEVHSIVHSMIFDYTGGLTR